MKRNGPASATSVTHPVNQLERLAGQGLNPQDYFKNAKQAGMNPLEGVLQKKSGPGFPDTGKEKKSKKMKKSKKDKKKKKNKKKKKKKDKKKKKKDKKKKGKQVQEKYKEKEGLLVFIFFIFRRLLFIGRLFVVIV